MKIKTNSHDHENVIINFSSKLALFQLVEMKHKAHSAIEVEAVVKLAARTKVATTR
jgi:hypothetical protein